MQILKKENKMFAYHTKDNFGDYVLNDERYTVNTAKEIYAPDNADLSYWIEVDNTDKYVEVYMADYAYDPLTEEQREAIMEAERKKVEEENNK